MRLARFALALLCASLLVAPPAGAGWAMRKFIAVAQWPNDVFELRFVQIAE